MVTVRFLALDRVRLYINLCLVYDELKYIKIAYIHLKLKQKKMVSYVGPVFITIFFIEMMPSKKRNKIKAHAYQTCANETLSALVKF